MRIARLLNVRRLLPGTMRAFWLRGRGRSWLGRKALKRRKRVLFSFFCNNVGPGPSAVEPEKLRCSDAYAAAVAPKRHIRLPYGVHVPGSRRRWGRRLGDFALCAPLLAIGWHVIFVQLRSREPSAFAQAVSRIKGGQDSSRPPLRSALGALLFHKFIDSAQVPRPVVPYRMSIRLLFCA